MASKSMGNWEVFIKDHHESYISWAEYERNQALLAGHASITTTQRYMNARANSLAESMRQARGRRAKRLEEGHDETNVQIG